MTDRQLLELLVDKVTDIGVKLVEHDQRFESIDQRFEDIKTEVSGIKATLNRIETKVEGIFEQTGGLLEFRTEMQASTKEIQDNQQFLSGIVGEHEMYIRRMRQRPV